MPIMPQLYDPIIRSARKRTTLIQVLCLLAVAGLQYLVLDFVVPRTAGFATPMKWRNLPLREKRDIMQAYLGTPAASSTDSDQWASGSKGKRYLLQIHYATDSTATAYAIRYQFEKWLWKRDYSIDSISVK